MKIAVLSRHKDPISLLHYRESIIKQLTKRKKVKFARFVSSIPSGCDLVWEPGLAGLRAPPKILKTATVPIVATVHGAAPLAMPWKENYSNIIEAIYGIINKFNVISSWQWFSQRTSSVISVSAFAAKEISDLFGISRNIIRTIYHGVDHNLFSRDGQKVVLDRPYFLHVSQYQPIKNFDRLYISFKRLQRKYRICLVAIMPNYKNIKDNSILLINKNVNHFDLVKWYRGSLGFVFPSLRESFGMPIIEAMASGCPVITSNSTACAEIAFNAAITVNPKSTEEIAKSMEKLLMDVNKATELRIKGSHRAKAFSWEKSAHEHLSIFEKALR